jgi:hypothetical protein
MATFFIGGLNFAWGMGIGGIIQQEELLKVRFIEKVGARK